MEYFALLIPFAAAALMLLFAFKKVTWWEVAVPAVTCLVFIIIFKFSAKTIALRDKEYHGSMIVEARYYEYWETWVDKTCSYTTTCCCDSKGNGCQTTTHYYDCSYCDKNKAYWMAYDDAGNKWEISQQEYNSLMAKWKATPTFVELNRRISKHGSCGKDGDMYFIHWNQYENPEASAESAVTVHSYTNRVQASHSAFSLPYINDKQAKKLGLYDYPVIYNQYKQKVVLGLDSLYKKSFEVSAIEQYYQYINGHLGKLSKVKLFVCLFYNKPDNIAYNQQAYWDGGNQNEIVICIGLDRATRKIQWVKPFSWTDKKRVMVDIREEIASLGTFDPMRAYPVIYKIISNNTGIYKDLDKDFSYLEVELTGWQLFWLYLTTTVITVLTSWWAVANNITREPPNRRYYY